jgi:hypothetical protein
MKMSGEPQNPDPRNPGKCYMAWLDSNNEVVAPTCDQYNCDKATAWSTNLEDFVAQQLIDVTPLNKMVGVDVTSIAWMKAASRTQAFGRESGDIWKNTSQSWKSAFGSELAAGDNYFVVFNQRVADYYGCMRDLTTGKCSGTPSRTYSTAGGDIGSAFLANVNYVATLITVTKHDSVVPTPAIAEALNDGNPKFSQYLVDCPQPAGIACGVQYYPTAPTSYSLPGKMSIAYKDPNPDMVVRDVIMPTAYESGHSVTMRAAAAFMSDIKQWYR